MQLSMLMSMMLSTFIQEKCSIRVKVAQKGRSKNYKITANAYYLLKPSFYKGDCI